MPQPELTSLATCRTCTAVASSPSLQVSTRGSRDGSLRSHSLVLYCSLISHPRESLQIPPSLRLRPLNLSWSNRYVSFPNLDTNCLLFLGSLSSSSIPIPSTPASSIPHKFST